MFDTGIYNYVDVLGKAADASWTRSELITNNIANVDTPGYKRKDVEFDGILARELKATRYQDLDKSVSKVNLNRLNSRIYTDSVNYSYRIDGNNVDIDTENVELTSNEIKYNALIDSISQEFTRLKSVIK